jgi:hypothetical protein
MISHRKRQHNTMSVFLASSRLSAQADVINLLSNQFTPQLTFPPSLAHSPGAAQCDCPKTDAPHSIRLAFASLLCLVGSGQTQNAFLLQIQKRRLRAEKWDVHIGKSPNGEREKLIKNSARRTAAASFDIF